MIKQTSLCIEYVGANHVWPIRTSEDKVCDKIINSIKENLQEIHR